MAAAGFALTVVKNINVMSMLSLSQAYAKAGVAQQEMYEGLQIVVSSARNWTHNMCLIVSGCIFFVFYMAMFELEMIPRLISIFGLLAVCLQLIAVSMPLFGHDVDFRLIMPLGICEIVLSLWLIARGFRGKAISKV